MRKTGFFCTLIGALGAVALFVLRQSQWFLRERLRSMSEMAEFVESGFWAFALVFAVGLLLLLRSLLRPRRATQQEICWWRCALCGTDNPETVDCCQECGAPYGAEPARGNPQAYDSSDWICPVCGRVYADTAARCTVCGYDRLEDTTVY